jgi:hypothetical protein
MPTDEQLMRLNQLVTQQGAITSALAAMANGEWVGGADTVEGHLLALNPTWEGLLQPKVPLYIPPDEPDPLNLVWIGSPNFYNGRAGYAVTALVIHTMAGSLGSCDSWFQNPASQVSAHFGIGLQGQQHQYVKLSDGAWANGVIENPCNWTGLLGLTGNPNYQTVSVETEDLGNASQPVTDQQYDSTLAVCQLAIDTYPGIEWLLRHTDISPRSRPNCCGDRWVASGRFRMLADDLGLNTTL